MRRLSLVLSTCAVLLMAGASYGREPATIPEDYTLAEADSVCMVTPPAAVQETAVVEAQPEKEETTAADICLEVIKTLLSVLALSFVVFFTIVTYIVIFHKFFEIME